MWVYYYAVKLDFIRLGKAVENAFVKSFNGRFRDRYLNTNIFNSLLDVQAKLELWLKDYNAIWPHSGVGNLSPAKFARVV